MKTLFGNTLVAALVLTAASAIPSAYAAEASKMEAKRTQAGDRAGYCHIQTERHHAGAAL